MLSSSRNTKSWHKKARWIVKKILINPPKTTEEMASLCGSVIKRRYGLNSPSAVLMDTAFQLWKDQNLVRCLSENPIFQNAAERIQNLSAHILPPSGENTYQSSQLYRSSNFSACYSLNNLDQSSRQTLEEENTLLLTDPLVPSVILCPSCGKRLQCLHINPRETSQPDEACSFHIPPIQYCVSQQKQQDQTLQTWYDTISNEEVSNSIENFNENRKDRNALKRSGSSHFKISGMDSIEEQSEGSIGNTPKHSRKSWEIHKSSWFGPLVLASLAAIGLAIGVFKGNGNFLVTRLNSLSSRALVTIIMLLRASSNISNIFVSE